MRPWPTPSGFQPPHATSFGGSPVLGADALQVVREPLRWGLALGRRTEPAVVARLVCAAALGPCDAGWGPPPWLLPHQITATTRVMATLRRFRGALLCDAVGMGKTYIALAIALGYREVAVAVPAILAHQWRRISQRLGVPVQIVSHESLSRSTPIPTVDLLVIDEAHRFRNPRSRRYDRVARSVGHAHLLLVTAVPVVNRPADLLSLVRLFLPDDGLAAFGMASIECAAERREPARIASSVAPLIVARSPRVASLGSNGGAPFRETIPAIRDARVSAPPVLCEPTLRRLLQVLDHLEFPSFDDRQAAELLRLHLLYRLASSPAACVQTLGRHRAYLDRAVAAARTGERLSRQSSRQLFGADEDVQLLLDGLEPVTSRAPIDVRRLLAECRRVAAALQLARLGSARNPKAEQLERLVHQRRGSKTIVFTGAVATALDLAGRLRWQSVAVVSGRGARIASGPLPVGEALGLFAPYARGAAPPPRCAPVDVLLATDLASEGVDLHDADAIVHFDLPWTPLRLQQRTGRVARLGSRHEVVHVWWFLPAARLERRMQLGSRIDGKARRQRDLGVPVSSTVARGQLFGRAFERRERLAACCQPPSRRSRCFAVGAGPPAAAFACRWHFRDHSVPELLVLAGTPPRWVSDLGAACALAQRLLRCPASHHAPSGEALTALHELLRSRLADAARGPANIATRCLARSLVRLAVREGAARRAHRIALLDAVLQRLTNGVAVGGERVLADVLSGRGIWSGLHRWLRQWPAHPRDTPSVTLEGAIFGDGTVGAA